MAHGTMIADYLVPIIAIFAGLNLHKRLRSTFALSAFRKGNYRQALITDVLKEICRTSLAVFIPYLIYLLFVYVFTMDGTAELGAYKYFLSDLLGERFFYDHVQLYYLIEERSGSSSFPLHIAVWDRRWQSVYSHENISSWNRSSCILALPH